MYESTFDLHLNDTGVVVAICICGCVVDKCGANGKKPLLMRTGHPHLLP